MIRLRTEPVGEDSLRRKLLGECGREDGALVEKDGSEQAIDKPRGRCLTMLGLVSAVSEFLGDNRPGEVFPKVAVEVTLGLAVPETVPQQGSESRESTLRRRGSNSSMVVGGALTGDSINMSGWGSLKVECPEASEHVMLFPESYCMLRDMMPRSYCVRVMLGLLGLLSWGGFVLSDKGAGFPSDGWRTLVLMALNWGSVEVPVRGKEDERRWGCNCSCLR